MREPVFTETLQISIVVRDLDETMRTYVDEYGIGPWEIYEFNRDTVTQMVKDDAPGEYAIRIAVTMVGSVQWSRAAARGDRALRRLPCGHGRRRPPRRRGRQAVRRGARDDARKGRRVLQGGVYDGVTFAYLSTDEDLGVVTEIFDWPEGLVQAPAAVYPAEGP